MAVIREPPLCTFTTILLAPSLICNRQFAHSINVRTLTPTPLLPLYPTRSNVETAALYSAARGRRTQSVLEAMRAHKPSCRSTRVTWRRREPLICKKYSCKTPPLETTLAMGHGAYHIFTVRRCRQRERRQLTVALSVLCRARAADLQTVGGHVTAV